MHSFIFSELHLLTHIHLQTYLHKTRPTWGTLLPVDQINAGNQVGFIYDGGQNWRKSWFFLQTWLEVYQTKFSPDIEHAWLLRSAVSTPPCVKLFLMHLKKLLLSYFIIIAIIFHMFMVMYHNCTGSCDHQYHMVTPVIKCLGTHVTRLSICHP